MLLLCTPYSVVLRQLPTNALGCAFVALMRKLGETGIPLVVRFDTLRKSRRFTIIGPEGRICDTDDPLEDLIGGLYLLFGLPFFVTLTRLVYQAYLSVVVSRFEAVAYVPEVTLTYSPRLKALETLIEEDGITVALDSLDTFGLRHLQEFYRRAAWAPRWTTPAPTGQGVL